MVICDKRPFIFLRIPKNASTSLAALFVRNFCGPRAKHTQINDAGIGNKNVPGEVLQKYKPGYRWIHLTLNELVENDLVSEQAAQNSTVVGCIREPFERQLSLYFFRKKIAGNRPVSVEEFRRRFSEGYCDNDLNNRFRQSDYCKLSDQDVGNYLLYERLDQDLRDFLTKHEVINNMQLPTYKRSGNKMPQLVEQYYDQKTRDAVMKYYEKDFELYERLKNADKHSTT